MLDLRKPRASKASHLRVFRGPGFVRTKLAQQLAEALTDRIKSDEFIINKIDFSI